MVDTSYRFGIMPTVMNHSTCHLRESAAYRLGLLLGAGGTAIAVMVLIAILGGTQ